MFLMQRYLLSQPRNFLLTSSQGRGHTEAQLSCSGLCQIWKTGNSGCYPDLTMPGNLIPIAFTAFNGIKILSKVLLHPWCHVILKEHHELELVLLVPLNRPQNKGSKAKMASLRSQKVISRGGGQGLELGWDIFNRPCNILASSLVLHSCNEGLVCSGFSSRYKGTEAGSLM